MVVDHDAAVGGRRARLLRDAPRVAADHLPLVDAGERFGVRFAREVVGR